MGASMLLSKRTRVSLFTLVLGMALATSSALSQTENGTPDQDAAEKELRQQTRQRMLDRWKMLRAYVRMDGEEQEVDRHTEPIFTCRR